MNADKLRAPSTSTGKHLQLLLLLTTALSVGCRDSREPQPHDSSQSASAAVASDNSDNDSPDPLGFRGPTMGTAYSIRCWSHEPTEVGPEQVQAKVDALLAEINRQMSTYDPESELSRFNRADADKWFVVSTPTVDVVASAIDLNKRTEGALDVTIAPVLRLWRFGAGVDSAPGSADGPPSDQLSEARQLTGVDKVHVRRQPPALRKDAAGLQIDLSSIAKGYGVDAVSNLLVELGFANSMVEIGGEVRCRGQRPGGGPWRIGVESPDPDRRALAETVPLVDMAMATSGDYRIYRRADGRLVTHIIDPRTGQALPFRGMSVTVLASTCMEADALATALVVLGDERAYDWCEENQVAALFQHRGDGGAIERRATSPFEQLVHGDADPPASN